MGSQLGFGGPSTGVVCQINSDTDNYPCEVTAVVNQAQYFGYTIQSYYDLPANTNFYVTLTTQNGNANEGMNFPTATG